MSKAAKAKASRLKDVADMDIDFPVAPKCEFCSFVVLLVIVVVIVVSESWGSFDCCVFACVV